MAGTTDGYSWLDEPCTDCAGIVRIRVRRNFQARYTPVVLCEDCLAQRVEAVKAERPHGTKEKEQECF